VGVTSPPLTADGVDKMYRQLMEIHAIIIVQLAECARWRRSDPTPTLVRAETDQQRPTTMPSVARLAPSPLLISHPRPRCGGRASTSSPRLITRLARGALACCLSAACRARYRASIATFSGTHLKELPCSSMATTFEGDGALHQSTSRDRRYDKKQTQASVGTE
jgi:hypothetical protein